MKIDGEDLGNKREVVGKCVSCRDDVVREEQKIPGFRSYSSLPSGPASEEVTYCVGCGLLYHHAPPPVFPSDEKLDDRYGHINRNGLRKIED